MGCAPSTNVSGDVNNNGIVIDEPSQTPVSKVDQWSEVPGRRSMSMKDETNFLNQEVKELSHSKMSSNSRLPSTSKTKEGFLVRRTPPASTLPESLVPVTELFNLISIGYRVPHITDPSYMLIIDCREYTLYSECHIITARHHTALDEDQDCLLDAGGCNKYTVIVAYGHTAEDAKAKEVYERIDRKDLYVQLVDGGFEKFSSFAPFLCSDKILRTEQERLRNIITYPSVIMEDALYQGGAVHAENKEVIDNIRVTHIVNVSTEVECPFRDSCEYLHLKFADESGVNLFSVFEKAADFIADALRDSGNRVLVHCVMGVSRSSSITIAFLMKYLHFSFNDSYKFLKERRSVAAPNTGFVHQLSSYEERLFGTKFTDPDEILFSGGPQ